MLILSGLYYCYSLYNFLCRIVFILFGLFIGSILSGIGDIIIGISFGNLLLCFRSHIFLIENRTLVFPYGIINIQIQVEEVQIRLI